MLTNLTGGVFVDLTCCDIGFICAVKEVDLEYVSDIREIDLLESLPPHPNYVQYFCHRRVGTTLQIFLKQYSGSLLDMIQEKSESGDRFSPKQIVGILQDINEGLDFLHRNRVIHRGASGTWDDGVIMN